MKFFLFHAHAKDLKVETDKQISVTTYEPFHNVKEGSEFLDDQIRSKDQPLMQAEESMQPVAMKNYCSAPIL